MGIQISQKQFHEANGEIETEGHTLTLQWYQACIHVCGTRVKLLTYNLRKMKPIERCVCRMFD